MAPKYYIHILSFFLIFTNLGIAQLRIDGTITDSELNPINNLLITLIDDNDSLNSYSARTNELGYFNISGITDVRSESYQVPNDYIVLRNYPNPFNPSTIVYFEIPDEGDVKIEIFDILGRRVRKLIDKYSKSGIYQITWDGRNNLSELVSAGIYFCRLKSKEHFKVHKMVLLDGGTSSGSINNLNFSPQNKKIELTVDQVFNFSMKISGESILVKEISNLACSNDTTINLIVSRILNSINIGSEGGKYESGDFSLIVPKGSFSTSETLHFAYPHEEDPFEEERVSKEIIIDGLPYDYSKPLKLIIKHNDDLSDESFILVGEKGLSPEHGSEQLVYDFHSVIDSSGYFNCYLSINSDSTSNSNQRIKKTNSETKRILVKAVSKYHTFKNLITMGDSTNEYRVYLPASNPSLEPKIIEFFDYAYQKCIDNAELIALSIPPAIYIANLKVSIFCQFAYRNAIGNTKAKGLFAVNSKHLNNLTNYDVNEKMKMSVGKEVLRFVLFNFDPTYPTMAHPASEEHQWLKQALLTWFEKPLVGDYDYIPIEFKGNELAPFNGMHAGISAGGSDKLQNAKKHGMGMASLFEFIYQSPNWKLIPGLNLVIFENIKKGMHPIEAYHTIYSGVPHPQGKSIMSLMWFEYLSSYVHNRVNDEIFYVDYDVFTRSIKDKETFNINSASDSLQEFKYAYKDLSGKLFKINVKDDAIRNNGELIFNLDEDSTKLKNIDLAILGVYKGEGFTPYMQLIEQISTSEDQKSSLLINELHKYDPLVALVINGNYKPPYTNNTDIKLDIKINQSKFKFCDIRLSVVGIEDTTEGRWSPGWYTDGYFVDNIYYGRINTERQGGNAEGTIKIEVDENFDIISLNVIAYHSDQWGSSEWGFSASNIPVTEKEPYLAVYSYSGYSVCSYVNSIYGYYEYTNSPSSLINKFKCESESLLHIKFHNWD